MYADGGKGNTRAVGEQCAVFTHISGHWTHLSNVKMQNYHLIIFQFSFNQSWIGSFSLKLKHGVFMVYNFRSSNFGETQMYDIIYGLTTNVFVCQPWSGISKPQAVVVCVPVHVCVGLFECLCVCVCVCVWVWMCVCVCVCVCVSRVLYSYVSLQPGAPLPLLSVWVLLCLSVCVRVYICEPMCICAHMFVQCMHVCYVCAYV
jgi:hypothetical protein